METANIQSVVENNIVSVALMNIDVYKRQIHTRCMMVLVEQVVFLLLHKIALKKLLTKEARMFKCCLLYTSKSLLAATARNQGA